MPIDPGTTTPIFIASLLSNGQIGPGIGQLAGGLALGLFQYAQAGISVNSIDAGTLGAGTGIGPSIILPSPILQTALLASFVGHGIIGPMMPAQVNAIATGVSAALALAIVQTLDPLVGVGAGKLQLIPNGTGSAIFAAAFLESGLAGPQSSKLATAVGLGLDAVIAAAIGVLAIVGPPSIIPSGGLGIGKII